MNKKQEILGLLVRVKELEDRVWRLESVVTTLESEGIIELVLEAGKSKIYHAPNRQFNEFKWDIEKYLGIEKIADPPRYRKKPKT